MNNDDPTSTTTPTMQPTQLLQHEIDHLDGKLILDCTEGGGRGVISREEFEKDPGRFRTEVDYFIEPTIDLEQ